jgi:hypothetical protein
MISTGSQMRAQAALNTPERKILRRKLGALKG